MHDEQQMLVYLTDNGYVKNPGMGSLSKTIPHGGIVCKVLNEYFGNPILPDWAKNANGKADQRLAILNRARVQINRNSVPAKIDPIIKFLPLISDDRPEYIKRFSEATFTELFPKEIKVEFVWDGKQQALFERVFVKDLDALLMYDIGKVIAGQIPIHKCQFCERYFIPGRKNEKYCQEHRKEGQSKTRLSNLQNDRCRKLDKRISDLLAKRELRHGYGAITLYEYQRDRDHVKARYQSGAISEQDYYTWLESMHTRLKAGLSLKQKDNA